MFMARIFFTAVIALHGIIHLIGFSKEWKLGPAGGQFSKTLVPFSENGSKIAGLLWLAACIFMIASAYLFFVKAEWYWIPAFAGLIVSQTLIVLYWHDAKYGTIVNVIVALLVIVGSGVMSYNRLVRREINSIISKPVSQQLIAREDLVELPIPVQRWLSNSGVIGKSIPKYIHVVQQGSMRSKPDGKWMPFNAEQVFTIQEPAFVWNATIKASFVPIAGRDKFIGGHGNMLIKPLYIYKLANSSGEEIDQGTLVRYLAEMIWFPHAAISNYLRWEAIDDTHARAIMTYKDLQASGVYTFNDDGDVIAFEAMRYGDFDGEFRKELWSIATGNPKTFNGIRAGSTSEVRWKLNTNDFLWLKLEVLDIKYINEK